MALTQITTDGIKDGTITGTDLTTNVDLVDNQKLRLGTGNDLRIYFSGNDAFIENNEMGSTIKFKTRHFVTGFQERVQIDAKGNLSILRDDTKLQLGASQDLQIYHDGSHSNIINSTGELKVRGVAGQSITFRNGDDSANVAVFNIDDATHLYFDSSHKFSTNSTGIRVVGNCIPSSNDSGQLGTSSIRWQELNITDVIDVSDNGKIRMGDGDDLQIYHDGSHSYVQDTGTGNLIIAGSAVNILNAAANESMIRCTENGAVELYHNNSKKFETTSYGNHFNGNLRCDDGSYIQLGSSQDLQIYHSSNVNYIDSAQEIRIRAPFVALQPAGGGAQMALGVAGGAFEIFYNGVKKLETTSTGIQVEDKVQIGINDDDVASLMVRYSTVPTTLTSSFDGTSGEGTLAINNERNSDGSDSWAGVNNGSYKSAAIRLTSRTSGADVQFWTNSSNGNPVRRCTVNSSGNFVPFASNTYDLGSSSERWRNIYTNDLNLSNEGGSNDVDGTWGSYTIQEGAEDLFLVNKRSGKKYKFNLTEVS